MTGGQVSTLPVCCCVQGVFFPQQWQRPDGMWGTGQASYDVDTEFAVVTSSALHWPQASMEQVSGGQEVGFALYGSNCSQGQGEV